MDANNEQSKEVVEEQESKEESDQEEDDKGKAIKIDPNSVVLTEDEKSRAREKFDMEDIDYDGQIDEQQCVKLLVGKSDKKI